MRERWGTFSIGDHLTEAPFLSDVLLYDRLVIPVPDPTDTTMAELWKQYDSERLGRCLEILQIKTDKQDGLVLPVPWNAAKDKRFEAYRDQRIKKYRSDLAIALATQKRRPDQRYYTDSLMMTRELIKDEFLPALPAGVSKAWPVTAYTSSAAYREVDAGVEPDRQLKLSALIRHRFLTPSVHDPKLEFLKRAVDLAMTDSFRRKRARFYKWQEEIIELQISDQKAIEELEHRLKEYNAETSRAFRSVLERYGFTVIPIALGLAGAIIGESQASLVLAATGGLVQLIRFCRFDRKPVIDDGDLDGAPMIHDAQQELPLGT